MQIKINASTFGEYDNGYIINAGIPIAGEWARMNTAINEYGNPNQVHMNDAVTKNLYQLREEYIFTNVVVDMEDRTLFGVIINNNHTRFEGLSKKAKELAIRKIVFDLFEDSIDVDFEDIEWVNPTWEGAKMAALILCVLAGAVLLFFGGYLASQSMDGESLPSAKSTGLTAAGSTMIMWGFLFMWLLRKPSKVRS